MAFHNPKLFEAAKSAPIGNKIACPCCSKLIKKRSYQHKFCSTVCKDRYWNAAPGRIERTLERVGVSGEDPDLSWDAHKDCH